MASAWTAAAALEVPALEVGLVKYRWLAEAATTHARGGSQVELKHRSLSAPSALMLGAACRVCENHKPNDERRRGEAEQVLSQMQSCFSTGGSDSDMRWGSRRGSTGMTKIALANRYYFVRI
ncbi:hypothetical protein JKP88DRAFT_241440 [Tribonema minus]|uniref:Uncharacterized protein n=1 Tax=Tribonema minus TaxID=303371 RepID=A0A836CEW8_9STRA|nr:hypothetical protein JKP88DRAFT_241440 [Tribonema minus]